MSRLPLLLAALLLFGYSSSASLEPVEATPSAEPPALPLSVVHVADPRIVDQLVDGFHQLEGGAWLWTEQRFAVRLEPPPPEPFHSPTLKLVFSVPEITIAALGSVTVTATLEGVELGSKTISEPRENIVFASNVPPRLIGTKPLLAEFSLDKAVPPREQDMRELGIIAISVALR
ncbi:MAG: hypothetical protein O3A53_01575 [Acidobacteria bacterium]|nr:hypothetical protein [Acidobacteriota bacterium]